MFNQVVLIGQIKDIRSINSQKNKEYTVIKLSVPKNENLFDCLCFDKNLIDKVSKFKEEDYILVTGPIRVKKGDKKNYYTPDVSVYCNNVSGLSLGLLSQIQSLSGAPQEE